MKNENKINQKENSGNISKGDVKIKGKSSRKKYQEVFELPADRYIQTGSFKKCRKIYFKIGYGRIRYEITRNSKIYGGTLEGPFTGGPMGPGGGAYDWGV